jgi:hypothetical protein
LIHAVEVAFESIHVIGPEPTEPSQPGIQLLKRFWFQPVETALCVHGGLHETGFARRFGSAMISKDSILLIYSTQYIRVKVYLGSARGNGFSRRAGQ